MDKDSTTIFEHENVCTVHNFLQHADERHWWKQPGLRKLYLLTPIVFLSSTASGYDTSLINGLQAMPSWYEFFNDPTGSRLGLFVAMPAIAGFVALPLAPWLADRYGRRLGLIVANILVVFGSLLMTFPTRSHSEGMFLGGRAVMGFGAFSASACGPLLITEICHPKHRGKVTTANLCLWYVGAIVAAWSTYGTIVHLHGNIQWRIPAGLQCIMPGIQLVCLYLLPESPRYQISIGKEEEARQMLIKYHGNGTETLFVQYEFNEIVDTLRLERELNGEYGWLHLVATPGNRKRVILAALVAIFSQCSGNSLASYYLAAILKTVGITNPRDQSLFNGGLMIWAFLVAFGFAFMVDKIGRRTLMLASAVSMLICFTIWTACTAMFAKTGTKGYGNAVLAMIFLFYTAYGIAWPGLVGTYAAEIFPYQTRAKGVVFCFTWVALASVFNQYVNPVGLERLQWKFYFVYLAILVAQVFLVFFYFTETKGLPLEEVARRIDGEDSAAAIAANSVAEQVNSTQCGAKA